MQTVKVPSRRWYENEEKELVFPDRWQVDNLTSPGFDKPGLNADQIREGIMHPVEGPGLEALARNKKQAVIVIDDMSRPTPVGQMARPILDILHRAGMRKDQIRFLWALGSHGAHDMAAARKKLGDAIVDQYPVYNHDPFQNTVYTGRTPTGVDLWFNREFMSCDLKIGIGSITSHIFVGFSGGAKLILPGVAGIETIHQFHNQLHRDPSRTGLGNFDNNIMRAECDAAGDAAGLDFKADCLINRRGEITSLYAGSFRATHARGAQEAKDHYGIPFASGYDIVVSNAYGRANEAAIALLFAVNVVKPKTGTTVLIADCPEGQIPHYVFGAWGTGYGGRHFMNRPKGFVTSMMKRLIAMGPHVEPTSISWVSHPDDVTLLKTWPETLAILEQEYPGEACVCVIQDATTQYMKKPGE